MKMVVDASALLAVLLEEPDADWFESRLREADCIWLSPVNWWEVNARIERLHGTNGISRAAIWMDALGVQVEPITMEDARIALSASVRFRGRPAKLNLGDCFAYALAKTKGVPLLYKGDDFKATDLTSA